MKDTTSHFSGSNSSTWTSFDILEPDNMTANFQVIVSNSFSSMKIDGIHANFTYIYPIENEPELIQTMA